MLLRMLRPAHDSLVRSGKSYLSPIVMAFAIIFVSTNLAASERRIHLPIRLAIAGGGEYFDNNGQ